MKKFIAILIGITIVGGSASSVQAADLPGEQFVISAPADDVLSAGVVIEDSQFIKNHFATLQALTSANSKSGARPTSVTDCSSYGSGACTSEKFYTYKAFFGHCLDATAHDCVQSLSAKGADGISHEAIYVEDFPGKTKYSFVGDPEANLPDGGSAFIVNIPDVPHSKGTLYLVTVNVEGTKEFNQSKFSVGDFRAGIFAVTVVEGNYDPAHPNEMGMISRVGEVSNMRIPRDVTNSRTAGCAQVTSTRCALAWPLPLNVEFSMKLKLRTKLSGWLHGRLTDVSASIGEVKDGDQEVVVSGKPVVVPYIFAYFHLDALPNSVANFYSGNPNFMRSGTSFGMRDNKGSSILKDYLRYVEQDFKEAMVWYDAIEDKANGISTNWSFRTIESGSTKNTCNLPKDQLSGLVTTNSNMFIAEPPVFNRKDLTLDYKVTSPHYLPDGSVFKGTYNLVMRSEFARCLYGFTKAPVAATVSILSADGTEQVATSVLGERDGWIYLSANNFTFSSPTLKVKLTQQATVLPKPEMTTQANPKIAAKKSITCVKGKIKKILGTATRCPTGYKKEVA